MSFHELPVVQCAPAAESHVHLVLDPTGTPLEGQHVRAGQFVQLTVGDLKPGFFAIASAPGTGHLEFLIQLPGQVSEALAACVPGDTVHAGAVMGKGFAVEKLEGRVPLFFATGSGISAVRSVIESRDWSGTGARLYLGNRSQARICYAERFADWAARGVQVVPVVSRPDPTWAGATGHVQDVYATEALPGDQVAAVFCGVKPMVVETQALLSAQGMDGELALLNF